MKKPRNYRRDIIKEEQSREETFDLEAKVTISIGTKVKAHSLQEAIRIAKERELADLPRDSYYTEDDFWVNTGGEMDGTPFEIKEIEKP